jgi:hypothetical protein
MDLQRICGHGVLRLRTLEQGAWTMARVKIVRPDGTPSPYFWKSDRDGRKAKLKTVFKQTDEGVKRLKGVRYDLANNTFLKD